MCTLVDGKNHGSFDIYGSMNIDLNTAFHLQLSSYDCAMKLWDRVTRFKHPGFHSMFQEQERVADADISRHFLFNATLVLIADMNRSNSALEEFVSMNERLECIQIAQNLLDQVSSASPQATIVRLFCRAAGISDAMNLD